MELVTEFHWIEADAPPYLIAEIGLNHNGDVNLAKRMIDAARDAGAHAAKFQMFHSELLIDPSAPLGDGPPGSLCDFFRQFELTREEWQALALHARRSKIDFACSVFDDDSLREYVELEPKYVKIASGDIDNRPLLERAARLLPVIFSTGTADEFEVIRAVDWVRQAGGPRPFAVLQCVSLYPALPEEYNLAVIPNWRARFGCPVGISDHCAGNDTSIAAVALGASIIERHFTLDRTLPGPDQAMSTEPSEFRALAAAAATVHSARGDGVKRSLAREQPVRSGARRSIAAARGIARGQKLAQSDLLGLRPAGGISAFEAERLLGRPAPRDMQKGERFRPADFPLEGPPERH